ncbi:hypothetical protein M9Y10_039478 [Tritrichomonas musculus]|uniref:BACK domain-containing protein n=1 Tax=Tritrichomonas musculus TaxID=1915356 RepID=A0ABR2KC37_9EUKA
MEKKSLIISASGLKNIVFTENDDFKFIFGKKEINMNRLLADFISPRIYKLHLSDPTITSFNFSDIFHNILSDKSSLKIFHQINSTSNSSSNDEEDSNDDFINEYDESKSQQQDLFFDDIFNEEIMNILIQISRGQQIDIDIKTATKLQILSMIIGNDELFQLISNLFPQSINETNIDIYLLYLQNTKKNQFFPFINENQAIEYISSHFYSIEQSDLAKLPKSILYSIISHDKLVIESEDSLFQFINELFDDEEEESDENSDDFNIISFYELIEFSELSEKKFNRFLKNFSPDEITYPIWKKLIKCFYYVMRSSLKSKEEEPLSTTPKRYFYLTHILQIPYKGNTQFQFKGIIHHLQEQYKGNVHDKGVVEITSSSVYVESCSPKNAANFESYLYFASNNEENAWICYDFKDRKVKPSHYSLRSRRDCGVDGNHLKKWCIEGSNDQKIWKTLDIRKKEQSLNNANASNTFDIQGLGDDDYFRYLRLQQIGRNTGSNFHLNVSALEYFGSVIEKID